VLTARPAANIRDNASVAKSGGGPIRAPEPSNGEGHAQAAPPPAASFDEPTRERLLRHARRVRLYSSATAVVTLLVVLILLISVNVRRVKIDWVVGSTRASLVWIVLAATVLGWLLGIATSASFRHRTRRRKP
jgi:uncharacterized integral membrane protein